VRLISKRALKAFGETHPQAVSPLTAWNYAIQHARPQNPAELRAVFGSVDFVRDLAVFNIGGNKFRLIAGIDYRCQIVYIKHILTHKKYDEGKWKK
jgi:mRNA interferase HigB